MTEGITKEIARLREEHWLEVRALLGIKGHDYQNRDMAIEGITECADTHNYCCRDEELLDLAEEAAALGDRIAARKGLGPCAESTSN